MADKKSRRLPQAVLQADLDALAALEATEGYDPSNPAYKISDGIDLRTAMQAKQIKEVQDRALSEASKDAAISGEWDVHEFVLGMRTQVKAQFGESSDQVAAVGLKKKSEYKNPKRKSRLRKNNKVRYENGLGNSKPSFYGRILDDMGIPKLRPKISIEDYLEGEKISDIKHEYVNGEVFAMAGTSKSHNRIIRNILNNIQSKLNETDCEAFFVDIKVFVEKFNRFYYPDLLVVCGEDLESEYYTQKPKLIIEVLSPSTALTDRREKMFIYKEIETVVEYILIEQDKIYAEIYRRRADSGLWDWIEFFPDEEIEFASVNFKMLMSEIYEGVELPEKKFYE